MQRTSIRERTLAAVAVDGVSVAYPGAPHAVVDASVHIEAGTTVALLGPSGCGKTSLLRAIAGLETPTTGSVTIGDRMVSAAPGASTGTVWVRPERRNIGMVFQDGALFPHLDVATNIAFGLRTSGGKLSAAERDARVEELLALVELEGLGGRLPETLSGGQQQRVALARSLAPNPAVLLLDEPFSALDAGLRVQLRANVARILREVGVTAVFVTHDQDEAFVLGDKVAVMRDGRVEQFGTPDELYLCPATPWVASFVGEANFVPGRRCDDGLHASTVLGTIPLTDRFPSPPAESLSVLIRPEQLDLHREGLADGVPATVVSVEYYGHDVRYELQLEGGPLVAARTHPSALLGRGDRVAVSYAGATTTAWPD